MYKVLLVDDERMIREGIAAVVDWKSYGFSLMGTARNGIEAFAMIMQDPPKILITDIKMPGLNGLELIAKVKAAIPDMQFVVLSGYGEFELAKQAMYYGVRHYLLKPCNEKKIIETLQEIKEELQQQEEKEALHKRNSMILEKFLPKVKKQLLLDFVTGHNEVNNQYQELAELLNIGNQQLRIILFQLEGGNSFEAMVKLNQLVVKELAEHTYLSILDKAQVVTLVGTLTDDELTSRIKHIKDVLLATDGRNFKVAFSKPDSFKNVPLLYKEVREYLDYCLTGLSNSQVTCSKLVQLMIKQIHENIANEELSLKWLASKVLFMNEGYLSKLFVKETGEKFSHYLTRIRMEKAKELLSQHDERICEVAQLVGYGNNPQYFSQLFKRYTGFVPSEYPKES